MQGPPNMPFYLITNDNQYGESIHCSLALCYLCEKVKRARCQMAVDLFSYMKILGNMAFPVVEFSREGYKIREVFG